MTLLDIAIFAGALLVAAALPGPGIAAIVARVLGRGPKGAVAFSAGVALGDVFWLGFAVLGLAALAQSFHGLFLAIRYAGAAYLLYLAYRLWTAPVASAGLGEAALPGENPVRLFLGGLAVTLGNPKVMVFYLALLPTIIDMRRVGVLAFAELTFVALAILAAVFAAYIVLAAQARRLFTSPAALRAVNRASGTAMAGTAILVASR